MLFQNFTVLHVSSDISVLVSLIMPFFMPSSLHLLVVVILLLLRF